jgi:hypothetical protein
MLFQAHCRRIALADSDTGGNELIAVGGQLRVIVSFGLLVEHDRVPVQGLKDGVEFIALPPEHDLRAIRLREGHLLGEWRTQSRHPTKHQQGGNSGKFEGQWFDCDTPLLLIGRVPDTKSVTAEVEQEGTEVSRKFFGRKFFGKEIGTAGANAALPRARWAG